MSTPDFGTSTKFQVWGNIKEATFAGTMPKYVKVIPCLIIIFLDNKRIV